MHSQVCIIMHEENLAFVQNNCKYTKETAVKTPLIISTAPEI